MTKPRDLGLEEMQVFLSSLSQVTKSACPRSLSAFILALDSSPAVDLDSPGETEIGETTVECTHSADHGENVRRRLVFE
jgi:hypothetical protein